jgi:hypothetical protein
MATYVQGIHQDYIPSLEPFNPDYKFLSNVLNVRQDRYDTNFKQLNNLYNQVANSPLSREDNKERRDQYVNRMSNGLKQVAGLDLSLGQNVESAKGLFRPFFEDDLMVKDIAYTKQHNKLMRDVNFFATATQEGVRDRYWQEGVEKMQMDMDDFVNGSANDALRMSMPTYVENPNIYERAFDALKKEGFNTSQTTPQGDWMITDKNGTALTNKIVGYKVDENGEYVLDDEGNRIPQTTDILFNYLKETVLKDPVVQRGLATKAYVEARRFYKDPENIQQYGSEDGAKRAWVSQYHKIQNDKDVEMLTETISEKKATKSIVDRWGEYKRKNKIIPGSPEEELMMQKIYELQLLDDTQTAVEKRIVNAAQPTDNLETLLQLGYDSYMAGIVGPLLKDAAATYSTIGAERSFDLNPLAKMKWEHTYDSLLQAQRDDAMMNRIYAQGDVSMALQERKAELDRALELLKNELEGKSAPNQFDYKPPTTGPANPALSGLIEGSYMTSESAPNLINVNRAAIENASNEIEIAEGELMKKILDSLPGQFSESDMITANGQQVTYKYKACQACPEETRTKSFTNAYNDLTEEKNGIRLNDPELARLRANIIGPIDSIATKAGATHEGIFKWIDIPELNTRPDLEKEILLKRSQIYQMKDLYNNIIENKNTSYKALREDILTLDTGVQESLFEKGFAPFILTPREMAMYRDGVPFKTILFYNKQFVNPTPQPGLYLDGSPPVSTIEFIHNRYNKDYSKLDHKNYNVPEKGLYAQMMVDYATLGGKTEKQIIDYINERGGLTTDDVAMNGKVEQNSINAWLEGDDIGKRELAQLFSQDLIRDNLRFKGEGIRSRTNMFRNYPMTQVEIKTADIIELANKQYDNSKKPGDTDEPSGDKGMIQMLDNKLSSAEAVTKGYDFNAVAEWTGQGIITEGFGVGNVVPRERTFSYDKNKKPNYYTSQQHAILFDILKTQAEGTDWVAALGDRRGNSVNQILQENEQLHHQDVGRLLYEALEQELNQVDFTKSEHPVWDISYINSASSDNTGNPETSWAGYNIKPGIKYGNDKKWTDLITLKLNELGVTDQGTINKALSQWQSEGITIFHKSVLDDNPQHPKNIPADPLASQIKRTGEPYLFGIPNGGYIQVNDLGNGQFSFMVKNMSWKPEQKSITEDGWITLDRTTDQYGLSEIMFTLIDGITNNANAQIELQKQWQIDNNIN